MVTLAGLSLIFNACTKTDAIAEKSIQLSVTPNEEILNPQQTVIISVVAEEWKQAKLKWSVTSSELNTPGELTSYSDPTVVYRAPQESGEVLISLNGYSNDVTGTATISFTIVEPKSIAPMAAQVVRDYYLAIKERQYEKSWSMLSENFKKKNHCCDNEGNYKFTEYTDFWDTIERVDVQSVEFETLSERTIRVLANLQYVNKSGKIGPVLPTYFELVLASDQLSWLIDKVYY